MTQISRLVFFPRKNIGKAQSSDVIEMRQISIVIPVKDNQNGINQYLDHFFKTQKTIDYPCEIIIVDNNSAVPITIEHEYLGFGLTIKLISCKTPGPAAARNAGVKIAFGDWILFNDSDCVPTGSILNGYLKSHNGSIGYAGNVKALRNDKLSRYYDSQEILIPPKVYNSVGVFEPQYLITANTLVWKKAFQDVNGFNESIALAGGEDVDFGVRLSQIGKLAYAFDSIALHDFGDGWIGFRKRFIRYGRGNRIVEQIWNTDLRPKLFKANNRTIFNRVAAKLQFLYLSIGYLLEKRSSHLWFK